DDLVAEGLACYLAFLQRIDRLGQVAGHAGKLFVRVGVATELGRQLELVLDAMESGRDRGRERHVRIGVGTRDAALDPQAWSVADDAEPAGPVVVARDDRGGCERARRVALAGRDEGRVECR